MEKYLGDGMRVFKEKYFVFVTSAGRTATKYFGELLDDMITGSYSVHEPDVFSGFKIKSLQQIRQFGLNHLIFGKFTGKTGIRNLSQRYLAKKINREQLKAALVDHRRKYYKGIRQDLIIESYSGWYGVIPGIRNLYKNYKIVVVIRDPRDWITSNMNWGTMYGKRDWVSRLKLERLNPNMVGDKQYVTQWQNFSQFQKLCWAWKTIYQIIIDNSKNDPNVQIIRFEDLFRSPKKYLNLENLLAFITQFSDKAFSYCIPENILERRIHKNISYAFPTWNHWNSDMKADCEKICGDLFNRFYEKVG
jgi:hypothetical protein